jgi:hypothetical protein
MHGPGSCHSSLQSAPPGLSPPRGLLPLTCKPPRARRAVKMVTNRLVFLLLSVSFWSFCSILRRSVPGPGPVALCRAICSLVFCFFRCLMKSHKLCIVWIFVLATAVTFKKGVKSQNNDPEGWKASVRNLKHLEQH